jgi:hypothetical protein
MVCERDQLFLLATQSALSVEKLTNTDAVSKAVGRETRLAVVTLIHADLYGLLQ